MRRYVYVILLVFITLIIGSSLFTSKRLWPLTSEKDMEAQTTELSLNATKDNAETTDVEADTKGVEADTTDVETVKVVESIPVKQSTINPPLKGILTNLSLETMREYVQYNADFKGWIKVPGTSIDMPLVQGQDNDFYLEYNHKKIFDYAGSLYYDYRNAADLSDLHGIIYGHYMKDGTMFQNLHNFKDEQFFSENKIIELYGLAQGHRYEIFSVQIVSADTYRLNLPKDQDALLGYAEDLLAHSIFNKEYEFPSELKLLTLVTCTYEFDNARLLIHAVRID